MIVHHHRLIIFIIIITTIFIGVTTVITDSVGTIAILFLVSLQILLLLCL